MADATLVIGDLGNAVTAQVRVGADFGPFVVNLVDENDVAIDISGCTIAGEIKKTYKDRVAKAALTIAITDAIHGVFKFSLPRTVTQTLNFGETAKDDAGQYVWYLWLRDTMGREFPIYYGPFVVVWGSLVP